MPTTRLITRLRLLFLLAVSTAVLWIGASDAVACGGFFCQIDPVDQTGERIVFTVNDDSTITTLIEILYEGSAADFSWILPIPEAISADDLAVPEEGQEVFRELHRLTDVEIIAPPIPECAEIVREAMSVTADAASGVEIFASGEVGPFGFDVIGSEDPRALIDWLVDNAYRVDPSMEPLIDVYVQEQFAFVAMRLLDGETSESITPIELTYPGTEPMIPLRLTAVAARADMPIFTWIFADMQAVPTNYAHMEIETAEISFGPFGIDNYRRLIAQRADANDGRAFITEFAGPGSSLGFRHSYLRERSDRYLTRMFTVISPEEMTVDPSFGQEDRPDVSNVRDASQLRGLYDCQRGNYFASDAIDPFDGGTEVIAAPPVDESLDDENTGLEDDGSEESSTGDGEAADESGDDRRPWIVGGAVIASVLAGSFVLRRSRSDPATAE